VSLVLLLVAFFLFRVVFWLLFRGLAPEASAGDWLYAWWVGFKFDLRLGLIILLPFLLLSWIPWLNAGRSVFARRGWVVYFALVSAALSLIYLIDLGHYGYLHERLNASALEHLEATGIALQVVWESYPVVWGGVLLILLGGGFAGLLVRFAFPQLGRPAGPCSRWQRVLLHSAFILFVLAGIYGKWSRYPLRWSDAFFHPDRFVSSVGLNPVLYFADTFEFRGMDYDEEQVRKHHPRMAVFLGVDPPDPARLSLRRRVIPHGSPLERPNLVLIHLESFAAFKCGIFGNALDPTPNLDRIAAQGTLFTHFFVTRPPTARCVFAVLFGIPDIHHPHSASRDPLVVRQHCIVNALQEYGKFYFIGGSASWGNIRGILAQNIPGIRIYEEGDYRYPAEDVWGISDLRLFEEANRILREQEKPFVAFIQTAGNHKPYTIPKDREGFTLKEVNDQLLWQSGFEEIAEFNSMRFVDYSLGRFFELASRESYFENTVFLMYGDHGTAATSAIPWEEIRLTYHQVPMVVYAPGISKQGRRMDTLGSLADLLPTAMGFTRAPYVNTTLGTDLFDAALAERFVYINVGFYGGLLDPEFYLYHPPAGGVQLHRYRSEVLAKDLKGEYPERVSEMEERYSAIHETAKYLLYHNHAEASGRETTGAVTERR
jgi:hypothetical protein